MNAPSIQIRRLAPSDAGPYREVRLEALRNSPEAFASSFEAESGEPLSWFEDRLASSEVFGAFHGKTLLGIAGFYIQQGPKKAHKATLWGMYVRPQARNMGIGRRLVEVVIDGARRRAELIQLSVVSENQAARRLYARLGFTEYGLEERATKENGRYFDDVLMAQSLARPKSPKA